MASIEPLLQALLRQIEPTASQKEGARRSHLHLRSELQSGKMDARITGSYLSGSYARQTAITPLDDVDVIITVVPEGWRIGFFDELPEAEIVLGSFARALRRRYPKSSARMQRRSVRLLLSHINVDVVPAVEIASDPDLILLPDRERREWIKSGPRRHAKIASDINRRRGNLFIPLVKLLKFWNGGLPETALLKSFAIETIAARLFDRVSFKSLEHGLLIYFDFLSKFYDAAALQWNDDYGVSLGWVIRNVPDTAGTGSNLLANVDGERRKQFLIRAVRTRDRLLEANRAQSESTAEKAMRRALHF